MLDKIISSQARLKILALFFENIDQSFYARQIVNTLKLDPANVHKELVYLEKNGFLNSYSKEGKKFFKLNQKNDFFLGLKILFKKYAEFQNRDKWFIVEEIPGYYPMMAAHAWCVDTANKFLKQMGFKNKFYQTAVRYQNGICSLMLIKGDYEKISKELLEKAVVNQSWSRGYINLLLEKQDILYRATDDLLDTNLKILNNKELYQIYKNYYNIYEELHGLHWMQSFCDFGEAFFSKYLINYLKSKINKHKYSLGEVFSILTTSDKESKTAEEYKGLLKILSKINKNLELKGYFKNTETRIINKKLNKFNKQINNDIENHIINYGWIGYGTIGPGWNKDYFINILSSLIKQNANPEKLLENIKGERKKITKFKKELIKDLNIDVKHQKLFDFVSDLIFTKGSRKEVMFYSYSAQENLFNEIGRRYYLSIRQLRFMYPHEFRELLLNNKFSAKKLNERYKFSFHYSRGHYSQDSLLEGQKAKKFISNLEILEEDVKNVKILNGDCASPGRARGEVCIVDTSEDIKKMKDGMVLISMATSPDLVPAIKKASAIITDVGGIVCHAAVISRELSIPCVVGTKIASKVLRDGDIVDVDATHGKISIIKKNN